MFGAIKFTKNADPDKISYSEYGIVFDFTFFVLLFTGVENSSYVHIDNKKKVILFLGKGPTHGLSNPRKRCLNLHYMEVTVSYLLLPQRL